MGKVEGLTLYQYRGCPFCARVERALAELGIEIEVRDTLEDRANAQALYQGTGRSTVPVLRIEEDGIVRWMPESRDIIAYLRERFG